MALHINFPMSSHIGNYPTSWLWSDIRELNRYQLDGVRYAQANHQTTRPLFFRKADFRNFTKTSEALGCWYGTQALNWKYLFGLSALRLL